MNRRRLKILLDTSFLLPSLGFETDKEIVEVLPCLLNHEVYYSDLSFLEALWKIVKLVKSEEEINIILKGVELLKKTFNQEELDRISVKIALEMYMKGHKDLIDNLLYGISVSKQHRFLTIDKELFEFVKNNELPNTLINPEELKKYCS